MKKICVIGIGGSGCDIVRTLEKNYKFEDNIKIIGSDSAICGMRDCKNKLPLEQVYPNILKNLIEEFLRKLLKIILSDKALEKE